MTSPFNRTGYQLGEKADKSHKSDEIFTWLYIFPIDINCIAHRLERVKADAYRKYDLESERVYRRSKKGECLCKTLGEEVVILKETQKTQIYPYA